MHTGTVNDKCVTASSHTKITLFLSFTHTHTLTGGPSGKLLRKYTVIHIFLRGQMCVATTQSPSSDCNSLVMLGGGGSGGDNVSINTPIPQRPVTMDDVTHSLCPMSSKNTCHPDSEDHPEPWLSD